MKDFITKFIDEKFVQWEKYMKEITINVPDDIQLTAGVITFLYQDINGDMNLQSNNLDFQTGNTSFDFNIKKEK